MNDDKFWLYNVGELVSGDKIYKVVPTGTKTKDLNAIIRLSVLVSLLVLLVTQNVKIAGFVILFGISLTLLLQFIVCNESPAATGVNGDNSVSDVETDESLQNEEIGATIEELERQSNLPDTELDKVMITSLDTDEARKGRTPEEEAVYQQLLAEREGEIESINKRNEAVKAEIAKLEATAKEQEKEFLRKHENSYKDTNQLVAEYSLNAHVYKRPDPNLVEEGRYKVFVQQNLKNKNTIYGKLDKGIGLKKLGKHSINKDRLINPVEPKCVLNGVTLGDGRGTKQSKQEFEKEKKERMDLNNTDKRIKKQILDSNITYSIPTSLGVNTETSVEHNPYKTVRPQLSNSTFTNAFPAAQVKAVSPQEAFTKQVILDDGEKARVINQNRISNV